MQLGLSNPCIALAVGQVVTLDQAAGRRIVAQCGTVWITEEGNTEDFIVGAGKERVVAGDGRTVVQALQPAWVSIQ